MKFAPGQSGNPAGRPKGTPDRRTRFRALFEKAAPEIIGKAIELAKGGDTDCLRLCIDRLVPALRPESVAAPLAVDASQALEVQARQVLAEVAAGRVSVDAGHTLLAAIGRSSEIERHGDVARLVAALAERAGIELPPSLRVRTAAQPPEGRWQ